MSDAQYEIVIGKDGQVRVKVLGSQGEKCMRLADFVRDILGREESREKTAEYYGPSQVRIQARLTGQVKR